MKALERYVKKNKATPYGKTKAKGKDKGGYGIEKKDQYAKTSGRKVVDDATADSETTPHTIGAYESIRSSGKKKQRSYLD